MGRRLEDGSRELRTTHAGCPCTVSGLIQMPARVAQVLAQVQEQALTEGVERGRWAASVPG